MRKTNEPCSSPAGWLSWLRVTTRLLSGGALEDPLAVDWSQLRYQHLAVLADEDLKAAGIVHIRDWPQLREADVKETIQELRGDACCSRRCSAKAAAGEDNPLAATHAAPGSSVACMNVLRLAGQML